MMTGGSPGDETAVSGDGPTPVDEDALRAVLRDHPVHLAVLFGSQVTGPADAESDVDIAVEFEDCVETPSRATLALLADLALALDRDDVDLSVVSDLSPRVGRSAFRHGTVLVGSKERAERIRERFEREASERGADRSLRDRFDETIDRVDRHVRGEG